LTANDDTVELILALYRLSVASGRPFMTDNDWQQAFEIFNLAREKVEDERQNYLAEACQGDGELRSQVERLLDAHESADGFLEGIPPWRSLLKS
jgi:hypothetical protein